MRIRGVISHETMDWAGRADRPVDDADIRPIDSANVSLNSELYSPPNAQRLAIIREHCLTEPQGVLLDVYQAITELELKHPTGSPEAKERYASGLYEEVIELADELEAAQLEHPYRRIDEFIEGPHDSWVATVLDHNRLRFNDIDPQRKEKCLGEMGDILWYSSRLAAEFGVSLSRAFIAFLLTSHAGKLRESYVLGHGEEIEKRGETILDFRLVQDIALSQKMAYTAQAQVGTPLQKLVTIDNAPHTLLNRIIEDDLPQIGSRIEVIIGKLVWFVAYTSSSILNTDFAVVAQANLEKVTARSRRGTIFNKSDRNQADEAQLHAVRNPRFPLGHISNSCN